MEDEEGVVAVAAVVAVEKVGVVLQELRKSWRRFSVLGKQAIQRSASWQTLWRKNWDCVVAR
jgi:hypothetical protein